MAKGKGKPGSMVARLTEREKDLRALERAKEMEQKVLHSMRMYSGNDGLCVVAQQEETARLYLGARAHAWAVVREGKLILS